VALNQSDSIGGAEAVDTANQPLMSTAMLVWVVERVHTVPSAETGVVTFNDITAPTTAVAAPPGAVICTFNA
jgi:hypothetical protein